MPGTIRKLGKLDRRRNGITGDMVFEIISHRAGCNAIYYRIGPCPPARAALPPDERRDRAKVNETVRAGLHLGPLRAAGSADLYGVPKATE